MNEKFEHKKSLGQNFLNSDHVPKKMCDAAAIVVGDIVLEIGPGTGALTKELLLRGAQVVAIEADARAIESLETTFPEAIAKKQLILHHHDARTLNPASFGLMNHEYKVVANIPYYLSGFLFRTILEAENQPNTLVFLIQKEVAERIARDKKESLLSLSIKAFGTPTYIGTIKKGHFTPPPKIDSAIIAINTIDRSHFTTFSSEEFFTILHYGFAQKRKQLLGNLAKHFPRPALESLFTEHQLALDVRAEDLPLGTWLRLVPALKRITL